MRRNRHSPPGGFDRRWLALLVLAALFPLSAARASPTAGEELDDYVSGSSLIVQGTLGPDGELPVERTLLGPEPGKRPLPVARGVEIYDSLAGAAEHETPLRVVAFLDREKAVGNWFPVRGEGVFALTGKRVNQSVRGEVSEGGRARTVEWSSWTPDLFLEVVRAKIPRVAERARVTALPRSIERARRLLALLPDGASGDTSLERTVKALTPPDPDEELAVGIALGEAADEERPPLLRLIREVGYGRRRA
jgi:hypothetical protein